MEDTAKELDATKELEQILDGLLLKGFIEMVPGEEEGFAITPSGELALLHERERIYDEEGIDIEAV